MYHLYTMRTNKLCLVLRHFYLHILECVFVKIILMEGFTQIIYILKQISCSETKLHIRVDISEIVDVLTLTCNTKQYLLRKIGHHYPANSR